MIIKYRLKVKGKNNSAYIHGLTDHRLHTIWGGIIQRTSNPKDKQYSDYGGRGIKMYFGWKWSFICFFNWAINNGYADHLVIDRINNDGHYCPSNCRWVTRKINNRNSRHNNLFTIHGKTKCLIEWSEIYNIKYKTLWSRIYKSEWDIEKALTTPIQNPIENLEKGRM